MSDQQSADSILGTDQGNDLDIIHMSDEWAPGLAYCGVPLLGGVHIPEEEVTDEAWCPMCAAIERAILS